jgi:uncharacterized protein
MKEWTVLCDRISSVGRIAVSFSGGIDSTVLLAAAVRTLPDDHLAVFADIPLLSDRQRRTAANIAGELGADLIALRLGWEDMPGVQNNREDRCYICKTAIYSALRRAASDKGFEICADGENSSDKGDERPGRRAAAELGIISPLKDLGFTKGTVMKMFSGLGLTTDVQKETCMATRLPADTFFDDSDIRLIERCEKLIRDISGVRQIRMRIRNGTAHLFTGPDSIHLLLANENELSCSLRENGIAGIKINMKGYDG